MIASLSLRLVIITIALSVFCCAPDNGDIVFEESQAFERDFNAVSALAHDSGFNGLLITVFERRAECDERVEPEDRLLTIQYVGNVAGARGFEGEGVYEFDQSRTFSLLHFEEACDAENALVSEGSGEIESLSSDEVSGSFNGEFEEGAFKGRFRLPLCEGNAPALPTVCE